MYISCTITTLTEATFTTCHYLEYAMRYSYGRLYHKENNVEKD